MILKHLFIIVKPPKVILEATFNGKDYLSYQIAAVNEYSSNYEEEFNLDFRTSRSSGLLVYAGKF
jgi:hypothetical protein